MIQRKPIKSSTDFLFQSSHRYFLWQLISRWPKCKVSVPSFFLFPVLLVFGLVPYMVLAFFVNKNTSIAHCVINNRRDGEKTSFELDTCHWCSPRWVHLKKAFHRCRSDDVALYTVVERGQSRDENVKTKCLLDVLEKVNETHYFNLKTYQDLLIAPYRLWTSRYFFSFHAFLFTSPN